ncbi:GIY-YIG nuclease family protein [Sporosalibacterium faouarense]|uniref:GIY-YIG nuclease family protein n=1 Tax=Sporosalibacterium faouarense TaxID=516123 RepID=UPI00192BDEE3|nr:GIY-YIG nuclease family protein [Sporosalibacterium faouarense]
MELKEKAKSLPNKPGVYFMKDFMDNIIYIGKSKNLRNRVSSYFINNSSISNKVKEMIGNIENFEYFLTDTEVEALLLESKLIKEKQPMYNRQLKNTRRYVYISISVHEEYPRIKVVYEKEDKNYMYFGPYPSLSSAERAIELIKGYYPIIQCNNPHNKKEVCLNYHLKKCCGACQRKISISEYNRLIENIIELLKGNRDDVIKIIEENMISASKDLNFAKAAVYRDQIAGAKAILNMEKIIDNTRKGEILLSFEAIEKNKVKCFFIQGNIIINKLLLSWESSNTEDIINEVKNFINCSKRELEINSKIKNKVIDRDNIDNILIVASYLKGNNPFMGSIPIDNNKINNREEIKRISIEGIELAINLIDRLIGSE